MSRRAAWLFSYPAAAGAQPRRGPPSPRSADTRHFFTRLASAPELASVHGGGIPPHAGEDGPHHRWRRPTAVRARPDPAEHGTGMTEVALRGTPESARGRPLVARAPAWPLPSAPLCLIRAEQLLKRGSRHVLFAASSRYGSLNKRKGRGNGNASCCCSQGSSPAAPHGRKRLPESIGSCRLAVVAAWRSAEGGLGSLAPARIAAVVSPTGETARVRH